MRYDAVEMIQITPTIFLDDSELEWSFVHASGPGGQNVNKVASAVFFCRRCSWSLIEDPDGEVERESTPDPEDLSWPPSE